MEYCKPTPILHVVPLIILEMFRIRNCLLLDSRFKWIEFLYVLKTNYFIKPRWEERERERERKRERKKAKKKERERERERKREKERKQKREEA